MTFRRSTVRQTRTQQLQEEMRERRRAPAFAAAAWPVRTKIPAPTMPPIPSATRLSADKVRLKGRVGPSTSSPWAASFNNTAVDLRAQIFAIEGWCPMLESNVLKL